MVIVKAKTMPGIDKQPGDKRGSMQNPDENHAKLRWRKEFRNIAKKKLITFSSLYIEHYFSGLKFWEEARTNNLITGIA